MRRATKFVAFPQTHVLHIKNKPNQTKKHTIVSFSFIKKQLSSLSNGSCVDFTSKASFQFQNTEQKHQPKVGGVAQDDSQARPAYPPLPRAGLLSAAGDCRSKHSFSSEQQVGQVAHYFANEPTRPGLGHWQTAAGKAQYWLWIFTLCGASPDPCSWRDLRKDALTPLISLLFSLPLFYRENSSF